MVLVHLLVYLGKVLIHSLDVVTDINAVDTSYKALGISKC